MDQRTRYEVERASRDARVHDRHAAPRAGTVGFALDEVILVRTSGSLAEPVGQVA
jgi:hypothetical protein